MFNNKGYFIRIICVKIRHVCNVYEFILLQSDSCCIQEKCYNIYDCPAIHYFVVKFEQTAQRVRCFYFIFIQFSSFTTAMENPSNKIYANWHFTLWNGNVCEIAFIYQKPWNWKMFLYFFCSVASVPTTFLPGISLLFSAGWCFQFKNKAACHVWGADKRAKIVPLCHFTSHTHLIFFHSTVFFLLLLHLKSFSKEKTPTKLNNGELSRKKAICENCCSFP